jgi:RNA polymerase sporulation-specific sigma factor
VVDKVQLKIERSKIYKNLDILDEREREVVVGRFGLEAGGEADAAGDRAGVGH